MGVRIAFIAAFSCLTGGCADPSSLDSLQIGVRVSGNNHGRPPRADAAPVDAAPPAVDADPPAVDADPPAIDAADPPAVDARTAGITDTKSYPPPPTALPAAGGSYVDPVFGSTIIRVTDSRDGTLCVHAYAYWPAFNADGTRLLIACDDVARLLRFDPATDGLTADGTLRGSDGYPLQFEGATWSRSSPGALYALDSAGTRLWRIDVTNRGLAGYTLVKDFAPYVAGLQVFQLTVSDDENVFSFHTRTSTGTKMEAFAWHRTLDRVWQYPRPSSYAVDETHASKDGTRVLINWQDGHATMWDYLGGTSDELQRNSTDRVSGHFDLGGRYIASSDGWDTGIVVRTWDALHSPRNVLQYQKTDGTLNWSIAEHESLRADVDTYSVVSTYAGDGTWQPFEDEIFLVRNDGGGFVRLAHTLSYQKSSDSGVRYWAQPRAVVDRTGRYVVYTSDLGSATRLDVMILKVPPAYWP